MAVRGIGCPRVVVTVVGTDVGPGDLTRVL